MYAGRIVVSNNFKFQSDSINTRQADINMQPPVCRFKFQSDSINTYNNKYFCLRYVIFKFQSDSINTWQSAESSQSMSIFKFQSDSINTAI